MLIELLPEVLRRFYVVVVIGVGREESELAFHARRQDRDLVHALQDHEAALHGQTIRFEQLAVAGWGYAVTLPSLNGITKTTRRISQGPNQQPKRTLPMSEAVEVSIENYGQSCHAGSLTLSGVSIRTGACGLHSCGTG